MALLANLEHPLSTVKCVPHILLIRCHYQNTHLSLNSGGFALMQARIRSTLSRGWTF